MRLVPHVLRGCPPTTPPTTHHRCLLEGDCLPMSPPDLGDCLPMSPDHSSHPLKNQNPNGSSGQVHSQKTATKWPQRSSLLPKNCNATGWKPVGPLAGSLNLFACSGSDVVQCYQRCVILIVRQAVRFPHPLDLLLRHQHGRSLRLCFHVVHVVLPASWPRIKLCLARYSTPLHEAQDGVQLFLRVDWGTIPDLPNPLPAA